MIKKMAPTLLDIRMSPISTRIAGHWRTTTLTLGSHLRTLVRFRNEKILGVLNVCATLLSSGRHRTTVTYPERSENAPIQAIYLARCASPLILPLAEVTHGTKFVRQKSAPAKVTAGPTRRRLD